MKIFVICDCKIHEINFYLINQRKFVCGVGSSHNMAHMPQSSMCTSELMHFFKSSKTCINKYVIYGIFCHMGKKHGIYGIHLGNVKRNTFVIHQMGTTQQLNTSTNSHGKMCKPQSTSHLAFGYVNYPTFPTTYM